MHLFKLFDFQLFADASAAAGEGGEGGEAGVNSPAAGESRLEALGVPADKREKWARSKQRRGLAPAAQQEASPAAASSEGDASPSADADIPYETIRNDPKYKQRFDQELSETIRRRLANSSRDREAMQDLNESTSYMASYYGLKDGYTMKDLAAAIMADDHFAEKVADDEGVDVETAKRNIKDRLELERLRKEKKLSIDRQEGMAHLDKLREQAQNSALLNSIPGFNFDQAMADDAFFKLTSPQFGLSPEQAYLALHGNDIVDSVKSQKNEQAIAMVSDNIRAGKGRVRENGPAVASQVSAPLYSQMTREERARFKQQAAQATARGERFGFNNFK